MGVGKQNVWGHTGETKLTELTPPALVSKGKEGLQRRGMAEDTFTHIMSVKSLLYLAGKVAGFEIR